MDQISYAKLELQPYLKSGEINFRRKKLLYRTRNRMLHVAKNFGKKKSCPVCLSTSPDNQEHLLNCDIIKILRPEMNNDRQNSYEYIFSDDIAKMNDVITYIEGAIRTREEFLQDIDK